MGFFRWVFWVFLGGFFNANPGFKYRNVSKKMDNYVYRVNSYPHSDSLLLLSSPGTNILGYEDIWRVGLHLILVSWHTQEPATGNGTTIFILVYVSRKEGHSLGTFPYLPYVGGVSVSYVNISKLFVKIWPSDNARFKFDDITNIRAQSEYWVTVWKCVNLEHTCPSEKLMNGHLDGYLSGLGSYHCDFCSDFQEGFGRSMVF